MLSLSLSLLHYFLCLSLALSLSLQSSTGNWEWAIKRSQTCAAWETRGRAIYCPLIYYKPSLSPLLCGVCVRVACICVCEIRLWDGQVRAVLLIIHFYVSKWQYTQLTWYDELLRRGFITVLMILVSIFQQIKSRCRSLACNVSASHMNSPPSLWKSVVSCSVLSLLFSLLLPPPLSPPTFISISSDSFSSSSICSPETQMQ